MTLPPRFQRSCAFRKENGEACRAAPLTDDDYCFWHSPSHAEEVAAASHLGGLRRKREVTVQGAYELHGLKTVDEVRRVIEIAILDTLAMENSISRSRTLAYLALAALKAFELGEHEQRIAVLEAAVLPAGERPVPAFDAVVEGIFEEQHPLPGEEKDGRKTLPPGSQEKG